MTFIDDLLDYDDEPIRVRRGRGAVFAVLVSVCVSAAIAWFLWLVFRAFGIGAPYVFLFSLLLTLSVLRAVLAGIAAPDLPATLRDVPKRRGTGEDRPDDGMRTAVGLWESRLNWTHQDVRRFGNVVAPAIAGIVDERLRLRYGVSLGTDPVQAQQLIDPQLWKFIHQPVSRSVTPQELATLVAQMEAL